MLPVQNSQAVPRSVRHTYLEVLAPAGLSLVSPPDSQSADCCRRRPANFRSSWICGPPLSESFAAFKK
jgi:hypothetical protein